MERLTKWNDKTEGAELISWNEEEWKDFMGSLDVPICTELSLAVEKLAEYEDAEEQGLLLRLPCKIGSTLYDIIDFVEGNNFLEIYVIDASKIEVSKDKKGILYTIDCTEFRENDFGTTVFSSMEEAEQALAKMKEV